MSLICPTVLASDSQDYERQLKIASGLSRRIQVDLMDGDFAPSRSVTTAQAWWPDDSLADIHLMYRRPSEQLESLVSLRPHMVILHAEADGDLAGCLDHLKSFGMRTGLALLPATEPQSVSQLIERVDHVLIFSGQLGRFGGQADLSLLAKVTACRSINPELEFGWDGGANADNVRQLADGGIDIINVGGAIQRSDQPERAYAKLESLIKDR